MGDGGAPEISLIRAMHPRKLPFLSPALETNPVVTISERMSKCPLAIKGTSEVLLLLWQSDGGFAQKTEENGIYNYCKNGPIRVAINLNRMIKRCRVSQTGV